MSETRQRICFVLFDRFELLDVFGPAEIFGVLGTKFELVVAGPAAGAVASNQGPKAIADVAYADAPDTDIVVVPGGIGNRGLVEDPAFLEWLARYAGAARYVTSVCTGAGLLAAAGLLDGYRATSNKRSFDWVRAQGPRVQWVPEARWVEDRNRWTSGGVAAGIDMALALVAHLHGSDVAQSVADNTEYEWHSDAAWDPFAALHGLT